MRLNLGAGRNRSTLNRGRMGTATSITGRMTPGERARARRDAAAAFRSHEK